MNVAIVGATVVTPETVYPNGTVVCREGIVAEVLPDTAPPLTVSGNPLPPRRKHGPRPKASRW